MQQAEVVLKRKPSQELEGHGSSPVYMFTGASKELERHRSSPVYMLTGASSGMMPTMPSSCCSWRSLEAQMLVL